MLRTIPIKCEHSAVADPSELRPHPGNPNKHPKNQIRLLAKSIDTYGWRHPILVSKRSGLIIAGHASREAALLLECQAPVDTQDFDSDESELAVLLADNIIPELASLDNDLLDAGKDLLRAAEIDFETIGLEDIMLGDENKEIDFDDMDGLMKLSFQLPEDVYKRALQKLDEIDQDKNVAFMKLIDV